MALHDNPSKRISASQVIHFIGFVFDFSSVSISISPERCSEILSLVSRALNSRWIRASDLASLAGKLIFVSQVVLSARRLFDVLKPSFNSRIPLSLSLIADLH